MNTEKSSISGIKLVGQPLKVNSLQSIMRLQPLKGSEWCVYAYVLNRDVVDKDGNVDDMRGMIFPLGSFRDRDEAEQHAKNVISITGHQGVVVAKYGCAIPLTTNIDHKTILNVPLDTRGKILKFESDQYKRDMEIYEKKVKEEDERIREAEEEWDIDSIEHFKRQCYLAIKNKSKYDELKKEMEMAHSMYEKRKSLVKDHYDRHPDHEASWLEYLKSKLIERGELDLYNDIESSYLSLRDDLLDLKSKQSEKLDDPIVCTPDCNNSVPSILHHMSQFNLQDNQPPNCDNGICFLADSHHQEDTIQ